MNQDKFSVMVKDGEDFAQIIQNVPEDKRFLLSMVADAFMNGLNTGERLAAMERPGA